MSQELVKTAINIAGRSYPIKVTRQEQAQAAVIEKDINTNIHKMQQSYPNMDIRDCLSMALIKLAFDQDTDIPQELIVKAAAVENLLSNLD